MVVNTQTDRVKEAQEAILEFLLINHPLDCPVCDKGGECPLQDITFGWGPGRSRFIEPKRHFVKPLALSPLIAIDRERCILCYRCVRFSQEIAEDYQLVLQERGADTYVSTFDGHPYVAPFSGNIIELCPVGALTSQPYRFRARPWDIEGSGSVCTLCPAQCNVEFTVRDERVLRVMSRQHDGVDDGWLCDKGRFAYQSVHVDQRVTHPLLRVDGELVPVGWDRALDEAAARAERGRRGERRDRRRRDDQRGGLAAAGAHARRARLAERRLAPRRHAAARAARRAAHARRCRRSCPTSSSPTPCSCSTASRSTTRPILDLRIRKGVRRNARQARGRHLAPVVAGSQRDGRGALRARRRRGVLRRAERGARRRRHARRARRGGRRRRRADRARSPSCSPAPARTS